MFRNQSRQKLATFNQNEFFKLLNDIVQEIIRRNGFLDESDLSISNDQDSDFDERIYDDGKLWSDYFFSIFADFT